MRNLIGTLTWVLGPKTVNDFDSLLHLIDSFLQE